MSVRRRARSSSFCSPPTRAAWPVTGGRRGYCARRQAATLWGFHRDEFRYGAYLIDVEVPVDSVMDWGMLGYFVGDVVQDRPAIADFS